MADPTRMQLHLTEAGAVEIMPHPAAEQSVAVAVQDVEVNDWRYPGGDADLAKWISTELEAHADDEDDEDDADEEAG